MAFFTKKKEVTQLPKLPELPKFPSYEPVMAKEINAIKTEVSKEENTIPIRQRPVNQVPAQPIISRPMPSMPHEGHAFKEEKPLFVKIDKYKEAAKLIDSIKARINEAEVKLSELEKLKEEELRTIQAWRAEIDKVKERLLDVDKNLFEV